MSWHICGRWPSLILADHKPASLDCSRKFQVCQLKAIANYWRKSYRESWTLPSVWIWCIFRPFYQPEHRRHATNTPVSLTSPSLLLFPVDSATRGSRLGFASFMTSLLGIPGKALSTCELSKHYRVKWQSSTIYHDGPNTALNLGEASSLVIQLMTTNSYRMPQCDRPASFRSFCYVVDGATTIHDRSTKSKWPVMTFCEFVIAQVLWHCLRDGVTVLSIDFSRTTSSQLSFLQI